MWRIRYFFEGVKNIIRWIPVIFKDKDWDQNFIYEILKTKIKHQAKYIGGKNRHLSSKRDSEKMMLCYRLIDKAQEDYYGSEWFEYYSSKINVVPVKNKSNGYELTVTEISERFSEYFEKYPRIYNQVNSKYNTLTNKEKAILISNINAARCNKIVFKLIETEINNWWD